MQNESCEAHRKYDDQEGDKNRQHRPEGQQSAAWSQSTTRIKCWADAEDDSSDTEFQNDWAQVNAAAMRGERDRDLASKVDKMLRETPGNAKKHLFQQMRRWPQEVLLGLAASLECDAWEQSHKYNNWRWDNT